MGTGGRQDGPEARVPPCPANRGARGPAGHGAAGTDPLLDRATRMVPVAVAIMLLLTLVALVLLWNHGTGAPPAGPARTPAGTSTVPTAPPPR